ATDNPNSSAVPVPISGRNHATGSATIAAPIPASTGARPFWTASTYCSRFTVKRRDCQKPNAVAATVMARPVIEARKWNTRPSEMTRDVFLVHLYVNGVAEFQRAASLRLGRPIALAWRP